MPPRPFDRRHLKPRRGLRLLPHLGSKIEDPPARVLQQQSGEAGREAVQQGCKLSRVPRPTSSRKLAHTAMCIVVVMLTGDSLPAASCLQNDFQPGRGGFLLRRNNSTASLVYLVPHYTLHRFRDSTVVYVFNSRSSYRPIFLP